MPNQIIDGKSETAKFLKTLFKNCEAKDGQIVVVSAKKNSLCKVFPPSEIDSFVKTLAKQPGLYVKTALYDADRLRERMQGGQCPVGTKDELISVPCFSLDVDTFEAKGGDYPPREVALAAIGRMPHAPTMIVNSNDEGGLHVYWCFTKPVHSTADILSPVARRLEDRFRDELGQEYKVDSCSGVHRYLRLPGARVDGGNVTIHTLNDDNRYDFNDLDLSESPHVDAYRKRYGDSNSIGGKRQGMNVKHYIETKGITAVVLLDEYNYVDLGNDEYVRPDSQDTTKRSLKLAEKRPGINVFSAGDPFFPGGNGELYTPEEMLVRLKYDGDWDAAEKALGEDGHGLFKKLPMPEPEPEEIQLPGVENKLFNYRIEKDGDDEKKVGHTLPDLVRPFLKKGWPKSCNGTLFVQEGVEAKVLKSSTQLMAWIGFRSQVYWDDNGSDKVKRTQFFEGLLSVVDKVDAISLAPHYPPVEGVHYLNYVPPGDVQDLYDFVDHFLPETDTDRQLMIAAVVTVFWGGGGGTRPLFAVTSKDSQGAGKTSFVKAVSRLAGLGVPSTHQIRNKNDLETISKKIGSASPVSPEDKRIIAIDNYSGAMLGSAEVEAMITEERLSVWKLYVGETNVPNLFTWFITGNMLKMSEDLSQRAVEIRLKKPTEYDPDWEKKLNSWDIRKVVSGVGAFFQLPIDRSCRNFLRFGEWSEQVFGRLADPGLLAEECKTRSKLISVDEEDAFLLRDTIVKYLQIVGDDVVRDGEYARLEIFDMVLRLNLYRIKDPRGKDWTAAFLTRSINRAAKRLTIKPYRTNSGRGFWFKISDAEIEEGEA